MDPRDQNFNFIPESRFLSSPFIPKTIDMSSPGITGIQQPLPYPYPPVNQGGGDGGGGVTTADIEDQGLTTADFAPDQSMAGDMGMTEEEQAAIDAYNNPQLSNTRGLTTAGLMSFGFLDPITAFGTLISQRNKQKKEAMEAAKEAAIQADFDRAMAQGQGFYDSLNDGEGASVSQESREQAGPGYSDVSEAGSFAQGGIVDLVDIYD